MGEAREDGSTILTHKVKDRIIPKKTSIEVPVGLENIDEGSYASIYLDREEGVVYRVMKWEELERDAPFQEASSPDYARRDFERKVEVAQRDGTGLTPSIYEYDPRSCTIKMEYIEGEFPSKENVTREMAAAFLQRLDEFHSLGLYHGECDLDVWKVTPEGEIRLVDPTLIRFGDDKPMDEQIRRQQEIDKGLIRMRLREFGISLKEKEVKHG